jgi:hypothetical protein
MKMAARTPNSRNSEGWAVEKRFLGRLAIAGADCATGAMLNSLSPAL